VFAVDHCALHHVVCEAADAMEVSPSTNAPRLGNEKTIAVFPVSLDGW
jgi:hypothetical protein